MKKVIEELILIANWLRKYRNGDFTSVYATIRSKTLVQSLKNLKEHLKSCSGNSNTLPAHNSPLLGGRRNVRENAVRRTSRRGIQNVFMKKASAAFMKYSPAVEGTVLGQRFQTSLLPETKDDIIEQELEGYLTSISALCKLMQSELQLMNKIIIPSEQVAVFDRVVQQALDNVISEGEGLATRVRKCAARHEFSTALSLFPVLRHLNAIKPEFDGIFQKGTSELRSRLQGLTTTLQFTINKALEEFVDCIKSDPDTKMPKDGTVHELTSNVMIMLEQLQDYMDMLGTVLNNQDLASFNDDGDINKTALARYIMRVLSALGLALQSKSESYNDPYLKAIFRLNNLHYILKALQRTNLIEIVSKCSPDLEDYYNDQICDQKRIYSQSWSRVLHYVLEIDKPISTTLTQAPTLKLKDKDRQNIKDKFTGFNKEMEEIYRIQKAYAIPDVELRESLKHDNKEFILPKYQMFYDKYASFHFTKNPEKYLKYLPADVSNMIDKFFDAAA
ncbi:exocyst complex component 7-like [Centruroides sculpturatus]|uniref:exocyst complex component 7-like n=1 Tax=Centruroides sculpturatus TaxID=218467 RepID=UPI000C6F004C|nr:exocyst complex component 7-like [Centruroides sculpturatus]